MRRSGIVPGSPTPPLPRKGGGSRRRLGIGVRLGLGAFFLLPLRAIFSLPPCGGGPGWGVETPRHVRFAALVLTLLLALLGSAASAQELTGTLKKIRDTGTVALGYREDALPFSYLNARHQPIGYSIQLCEAIVDEIGAELDGRE